MNAKVMVPCSSVSCIAYRLLKCGCTWDQPKHCRGLQKLTRLFGVTKTAQMTAKANVKQL